MAHADFVHLRVHTAYSIAEGAVRIEELASLCRDLAMPAVAMTDTNNLFGAFEFSAECASAGVQPIIGCQLSITSEDELAAGPLPLLVKDEKGYRNLLKLLGKAYLGTANAADPQVSLASLERHSEGLIALTGGPAGPVGRLLALRQDKAAKDLLSRLAAAFPGRLYVEIMRHGLEAEKKTEPAFLDLAYEHDLPLVATNEVFFTSQDMHEAHDALICISAGVLMADDNRRRLTPEHYFKSAREMREIFKDLPEAIDNTLAIARRTAFMVEPVKAMLPPYPCFEGQTEEGELRTEAARGLENRLETHVYAKDMSAKERENAARRYRERLNYELDVIVKMGFAGYFLIVADFIRWANEHGIPVGPGRGSGAGSLVAWALLITGLDPLRFGLLFERFLNPERVSMPDFDIDFCQDRRDEVIRYVHEKYGRDRVVQIITFGTLQARAALRDVGRVLAMPYSQVDAICKLVPSNPAKPVSLAKAIESEPQLRQMIASDPDVSRLMAIARKLEGLYRHASTHAAGVVIGGRPLDELIPLYRDPRSDLPVTGYNMDYIGAAGLVKFDFLGLKTLTVIAKAVEMIASRGPKIDIAAIPLDDAKTFAMLGRGDTTGVFQLESSGMVDVLRKLRPDAFEDIIAVVALYRPGPMENIPSYIRRKHGDEQPDYLYPTLEGILKETFGIIIYQEQVMQIAQELSGYTPGGADLLRRAMGKKDQMEMDKQRQIFIDGAINKNVPTGRVSNIFDQVNKFADYGFNKSHAAAYALIAYQTAYLKANHPVEFLAACMTLDLNNIDKLSGLRQELVERGITLLSPDINASGADFMVEQDGTAIRYALAAIKNVGEAAMKALVAEREKNGPFKSLSDFASRLDCRVVNKRQLENLARAGAFDSLHRNRRQVFQSVEAILSGANAASRDRQSGQFGLFGGDDAAAPAIALHETEDWPVMERMNEEFEAIGFYLTGHPLDAYQKTIKRIKAHSHAEVIEIGRSGPVNLAGTVIAKKERTSEKGNRYAFVQFSDPSGIFEVTIFAEILSASRGLLEAGNCLFIKANVQFNGETARFTAMALESLDQMAASHAAAIKVFVDASGSLARLREVLAEAAAGGKGGGRVTLATTIASVNGGSRRQVEISLPGSYAITPKFLSAVRALQGVAAVEEM